MKKKKIGIMRLVIMTVITVLIVGFIVLPFYSMVLLSIVPESLYLREDILLFPKEFSLESFIYVFSNNAIFKGVVITVIVTDFHGDYPWEYELLFQEGRIDANLVSALIK